MRLNDKIGAILNAFLDSDSEHVLPILGHLLSYKLRLNFINNLYKLFYHTSTTTFCYAIFHLPRVKKIKQNCLVQHAKFYTSKLTYWYHRKHKCSLSSLFYLQRTTFELHRSSSRIPDGSPVSHFTRYNVNEKKRIRS